LLELVLRFLLKPDVIRESIGVPYFRLITVCLSYLFERRPRLNLKDPTITVVIAHRRKTKKGMQLSRILSVDRESVSKGLPLKNAVGGFFLDYKEANYSTNQTNSDFPPS
jgi:hypothetical protein